MMLLGMTFWEWIGAAILTVLGGLSGGAGLKLIGWLKEHLDRKARKFSSGAKRVLEQADRICGMARAMNELFRASRHPIAVYTQASPLWRETVASILNVWEANAWVLAKSEEMKPFRQRFPDATERLQQAAVTWDETHQNRQTPSRLGGNDTFLVLPPSANEQEETGRMQAREAWDLAYKHFLKEFQTLHKALQPLVREYATPPEGVTYEEEQ